MCGCVSGRMLRLLGGFIIDLAAVASTVIIGGIC
jgi:hypothetical protein